MIWVYISIVLLVIHLLTNSLPTLWLTIGAQAAASASGYGFGLAIQILVFCIVSAALLIPRKRWTHKSFNCSREKTNIDALAGKTALVESTIDTVHEKGKVLLDGMEWSAKTESLDDIIEKGELVDVIRVEGVKLIVQKTEK